MDNRPGTQVPFRTIPNASHRYMSGSRVSETEMWNVWTFAVEESTSQSPSATETTFNVNYRHNY